MAEAPRQLRPCAADSGDAASLTLQLDTLSDRLSVSPAELALPDTVSGELSPPRHGQWGA